jgi:Uncharacterized conserved protein
MSIAMLKKHRRLFFLLLMFALMIAASLSDPVHNAFNAGLEKLKPVIRHHDVLGLLLFFALSTLSAIAFFFSTAVMVPVAVYTWGKAATILLLWTSWLLGGAISYSIGRRPGRRLARWVVPKKKVANYEKKFSAKASFPLVLLFQLAVPSEIPGYVLGTLRYDFWKFIAAAAIGELPFAVAAVYLGESFMRRQYLPLTAIALGGIVFSAAALYFLHKRIDQ